MPESSIFIFAGEGSADALGAMVIDGLRQSGESSVCWGVGGPAMSRHGFESVLPMEEFTVLGLSQALLAVGRLRRNGDALIEQILDRRPAAVLTIDNKGFSMRFARRLRRRMADAGRRAPILHLVAPTVWAWGGWRAKEAARSVDRLLCLFPFEAPYFTAHGLPVTVTGHPAARASYPSREKARKDLGLGQDAKALVLLPGSRAREIRSLFPCMLEAVAMIREKVGELAVLLPVAGTVAGEVDSIIHEHGGQGLRLCSPDEFRSALVAGDYGLICSGTVTLEAAIAGLSGSVYYRLDPVSRLFGGWLVDRSKVVLANAVAGEELYPLFLNREFSPQVMAENAVEGLLNPPRGRIRGIADTVAGEGGFSLTAAKAILAEMGKR